MLPGLERDRAWWAVAEANLLLARTDNSLEGGTAARAKLYESAIDLLTQFHPQDVSGRGLMSDTPCTSTKWIPQRR